MRVLITGSTGFVGQNLSEYLNLNGPNIQVIPISRIDLRSPRILNLSDGEVIVHLAGKAHDLKNNSNSDEYYGINLELTKKIYDAFLKSTAKKFIFVSSVKAVADSVTGILTEDNVPSPQTHYGKSKLMAEEYIRKCSLPTWKSYYILRPCMIHGPHNKGNLNNLYKIATIGLPYPLAAFNNERSFLTIENLCFVIKELLERTDIPMGIYNVADNKPLSTNRVMEIIGEELSKKIRFFRVNKDIVKFIARMGDLFPLLLNSERLNKLTENYVVSNRKIVDTLNKSLPLDAETGLRKTIQSFIHY